ncbi:MAG: glycosyltransferase family 4 protein, partial [Caldisphaera sp.]
SSNFKEIKGYDNVIIYQTSSDIVRRNLYMEKELNKIKIDAFFATFNLIPLLARKNFKIILQNHDWSHGNFAENIMEKISGKVYKSLHIMSCKHSDINISNSLFTQEETNKYCGKNSKVIYHDADPFYKSAASISIKPKIEKDLGSYILYVGRVYPKYKNISSILKAYYKIKKESNLKLISVHTDNYRKEDYKFILDNGLDIIDLKFLPKENVKYLYEHAKITIYPSLYEGFGFPILEAQSSGSPVIATKLGPMPEVGGDAALYFDGSANDLYSKVQELITDESARSSLIKKGYLNTKRFSWYKTSYEIFKLISGDVDVHGS